MGQAPAGISRQISRAVRFAFGLVLVVGGVSVLLAWTISASVEQVREQSREVEAVDRIHVLIYHFVADLHLLLETGQVRDHQSPEEILDDITWRVAAYEARERAQGNAESGQELARLERLHTLLARLGTATRAEIETSRRGARPSPSALATINGLAHDEASRIMDELHAIHLRKFHGGAARTKRRMLLISALYVLFAAGGGVFLFVADRFLSRRLVVPIARLGEAALRIARRDLSGRVPVRSSDEVGQLSEAFNLMAERLEAHEAERLTFETELERQVKERTRDLEATTTRLHVTQAQLIRAERIAVTGQIAAGVTHEIRTPLNSLAINVQLLRRELSSENGPAPFRRDVLEALVALEYEITRINRILEEFVNFARLPRPSFEPVEAVALIHEILGLLGPQAVRTAVRVEGPSRTAIVTVRGDPDQLRQVFLNLAQNALHAMAGGGVLSVEASRDGEWVEIVVADSGPGVPAAERETIFLPFVSTKADGLGLGLPIVRRIVEAHGGTVGCRERTGGGAVFVVRLPAGRADHEG